MCRLHFLSWQPTCTCRSRLPRTHSSHQCCASPPVSPQTCVALHVFVPKWHACMTCHISTDNVLYCSEAFP